MTWVARVEQWSLVLIVGGDDLSASLTGTIRTDTERGAARTLNVELHFTGAIEPDRYTGRAVTLDVILGDSRYRRFTGVVDVPRVEAGDALLILSCSDQRAAQLNGHTRAELDALVGAAPHAAFFDDEDTGSEYAEVAALGRLAAVDYGPDGTLRARDIVTASTPRLTLDMDDVFDASVEISLASADRLINARTLNARAQRNRYWRRRVSVSWDWRRSFADYLQRSHTLPNEGMWTQAVNALGWFVHSTRFTNLPGTGLYYTDTGARVPDGASVAPGATGVAGFINSFPELITGASAALEAWWSQQVTLDAVMRFEVASSIARHGQRESSANAALAAPDETGWASAKSPAARPSVSFTGGLAGGYQYADDADDARDASYLAACADRELHILYVAHSQNRIRIALPWQADTAGAIEPGDTLALAFDGLTARGIVARVEEAFEVENPDAIVMLTLALCRGGTEAVARPTVSYTAPGADALAPESAIASTDTGAITATYPNTDGCQLGNDSGAQPAHDPDRAGYSGNYGKQYTTSGEVAGPLYPVELTIDSPEVPAEHRDSRTVEVPVAVAVELPNDPLEVVL